MKKDWKKLIKNDTFIYHYLDYCENLETAQDFDLWGAIWNLSLICNRNVKINRPNSPLYPNFYITFIADSGIARKSTAINLALSINNDLLDEITDKVNILTAQSSTSKFNFVLTKSSNINKNCIIGINCPEFITFYKNKNIIECFTDLYDCPDERKGYGTFTNGDINICNVFISSLSGSTPNYYFKAISKDEIEGGFTSRNIIVYADKPKRRIAWGTEYKNYSTIIEKGQEIKRSLINYKQGINLSTKAIHRYTSWYGKRRLSNDLYSKSFEAREQDYVLKLACLLAINENCLIIDENHIDLAIKIIKYYKNSAQKFFNDEVYEDDNDKSYKIISRIREIIKSKASNGIKHRDLYLRVHNSCTSDEFNYIINLMHELGMIEMFQLYNNKAIYYRGTNNLYSVPLEKLTKSLIEIENS